MAPLQLVFLGTPAFAVPTLEALAGRGHQIAAVITQPDRPSGRGQNALPPPVKVAAQRLGLPVFQPERVRRPEAVELLKDLAPEAMVVVGYGQIIPQSVIDIPRLGILNVHASLLPKYRGAAPIQWAVANGESRTGVTIMRIDAGLDTGDILLAEETAILPEEDAVELGFRLAGMGARLLVRALDGLAAGEIVPEKQDHTQASYAPLLKKEDGRIDWRRTAAEIHNRARGLQPWPGAYTSFRGQTLHVWKSRPSAGIAPAATQPSGRIVRTRPLAVSCGAGSLELIEVQLEGRKRISATDFANGQRLAENELLGESPN